MTFIEAGRKELVTDALRAIDNLISLIVIPIEKARPDLRRRLLIIREEFERADSMDPKTEELFAKFLDLQDEILTELNGCAE